MRPRIRRFEAWRRAFLKRGSANGESDADDLAVSLFGFVGVGRWGMFLFQNTLLYLPDRVPGVIAWCSAHETLRSSPGPGQTATIAG